MKRIIITEGTESSMVSVPKQKKFKCPYCEERIERTKLHLHIQRKHEELIPESFSALRVAFNTINHKNEGHCIIDQSITKWNEDKGRYERLCGKKECLDKYKKIVADRNRHKYGVERLQTDARYAEMVQKRALEGRSISGTYKFSDGGTLGYVGSYEKKFLEFMDMVMHCKSTDILSPGPSIPYVFEGKQHFYLPDFYYEPYNLIIEIKDGGKNPNKHPHRIDGERRIKAKEEAIKELDKYSYVRVTDNDFSRLLSIMAVLKYNLSEGNDENVIMDGDKMHLQERFSFNDFGEENMYKEQDSIEFNEDMVGTIGAALPNMSAPNPNHNNYYIVQHRSDDNFVYGITQDPDHDNIYEVEPKSNGAYKINKTNKQEIGNDCCIAYKIKNKEAAKEIYHELHNLVKYNKNVFYDSDYLDTVSYIYSRVTEGSDIIDHNQLEYDTRFEKVNSIDDEIFKIKNEMYDYLVNGQDDIDLLENQIDKLSESSNSIYIPERYDSRSMRRSSNIGIPMDWNSEVPFNEKSVELLCEYLSSIAPIVPSTPLENISESDLKNISKKKLTPIFVLLFSGNRIENEITKIVTRSKWSHVAITLNESLKHIYSYSTLQDGFFDVDLNYYIRQVVEDGYKIYIKLQAVFVTEQQKNKIADTIKFYDKYQSSTSYSIRSLFSILFNKIILAPTNSLSHICSSFVYSLLQIANMKVKSNFAVITPGDLDLISHKKSYSVYEGPVTEYNEFKVRRILSKLK